MSAQQSSYIQSSLDHPSFLIRIVRQYQAMPMETAKQKATIMPELQKMLLMAWAEEDIITLERFSTYWLDLPQSWHESMLIPVREAVQRDLYDWKERLANWDNQADWEYLEPVKPFVAKLNALPEDLKYLRDEYANIMLDAIGGIEVEMGKRTIHPKIKWAKASIAQLGKLKTTKQLRYEIKDGTNFMPWHKSFNGWLGMLSKSFEWTFYAILFIVVIITLIALEFAPGGWFY